MYFISISSIFAKVFILAKTTQFDYTNKTNYKSEHHKSLLNHQKGLNLLLSTCEDEDVWLIS